MRFNCAVGVFQLDRDRFLISQIDTCYSPYRTRMARNQPRVHKPRSFILVTPSLIAHVGVPMSIHCGCSESMMHEASKYAMDGSKKNPEGYYFFGATRFCL